MVRAPRRAKSSRLATQVYVPDTTAVSTSGTAQDIPDASAKARLLRRLPVEARHTAYHSLQWGTDTRLWNSSRTFSPAAKAYADRTCMQAQHLQTGRPPYQTFWL